MSKLVTYNIPCPVCKETSEQHIFHSVNTNLDNIVDKILNNEINFATCKKCGNNFHVKTGLLFNNMKKMYALYYNPTSFELNEKESADIKRMLGENFYLANPLRFKDWEAFKNEIRRKEGLTNEVDLSNSRKYTFRSTGGGGGSFDNFWSCNICDGNSDTGCQYFDPTECPRHT